eukprot:TRINITY_DN488_c0_g2_i1.p1 TRINITY_DN488_c0_g2~~TRINITY_DN488_c0_g2_i1.p1  ORF type:complete len:180 (-),score=46.19 TRINITY_DN488_c0_g2_i1:292-807(-)
MDYSLDIFGSRGCGKSALIMSASNEMEGTPWLSQLGEELYMGFAEIADQEEYFARAEKYLGNSLGFIFVYTITSQESIKFIKTILNQPLQVKGRGMVPCVLVGMKADLEDQRQVSREEGKALAKWIGCPFFESSVQTNQNIEDPFRVLLEELKKLSQLPEKSKKKTRFFKF